jgi:hypothetical protein
MHALGTWSLALNKTLRLQDLWNERLWTETKEGLKEPALLSNYEILRAISRRQMVHVAGMW